MQIDFLKGGNKNKNGGGASSQNFLPEVAFCSLFLSTLPEMRSGRSVAVWDHGNITEPRRKPRLWQFLNIITTSATSSMLPDMIGHS